LRDPYEAIRLLEKAKCHAQFIETGQKDLISKITEDLATS
jgi:hypothetical protein